MDKKRKLPGMSEPGPSRIMKDGMEGVKEFFATPHDPSGFPKDIAIAGETFGRYQILKELGRGGMGVVYKAFDPQLDRVVALKMVIARSSSAAKESARFLREGKATAKFRHRNIVSIYDIGVHEQRPYFSMEFIEGISFKEYLYGTQRNLRQIVAIMSKVAGAIHHAHTLGIIHRDLKPANIMITKEKRPVVMDFGLAKLIQSEDDLSQTGEVMGTPAYMPPEQAEGKKLDHRADVYSLGATLYEALTKRPPFEGDTPLNILHRVLRDDPLAPRLIDPDIPIELEAICLKTLEKKPQSRYESAALLARDLQNFLENKPVLAKPPTAWTMARKFILQHRKAVGSLAFVFLVLIVMSVLAVVRWRTALGEWREAEKATRIAENRKGEAERAIELAQQEQRQSEEARQTQQTVEQQRDQAEADKQTAKEKYVLTASEWEGRMAQVALIKAQVLLRKAQRDTQVVLTTTQEAAVENQWQECGVSAGYALEIIKNLESEEFVPVREKCEELVQKAIRAYGFLGEVCGHSGPVTTVCFSPDGSILASGSEDKTIRLFNLATAQARTLAGHSDSVTCISFGPKGKMLASGSLDNKVRLWEVAGGRIIWTLTYSQQVNAVGLSRRRKILAVAAGKFVEGWDIKKRKSKYLVGHPAEVTSLNFDSQKGYLASGDKGGTIKLWRGKRGGRNWKAASDIVVVSFSPDSKTIASGGDDNAVKLWDTEGKLVHTLSGHAYRVNTLSFSPDSKLLASGSDDKTVKLWNVSTGEEFRTFSGNFPIKSLSFSPDGKILACGDSSSTIKLWSVKQCSLRLPISARLKSSFPINDAGQARASVFDFRADIPGWVIEDALKTEPQKITQFLFGLAVDENFVIKPFQPTGE